MDRLLPGTMVPGQSAPAAPAAPLQGALNDVVNKARCSLTRALQYRYKAVILLWEALLRVRRGNPAFALASCTEQSVCGIIRHLMTMYTPLTAAWLRRVQVDSMVLYDAATQLRRSLSTIPTAGAELNNMLMSAGAYA